MDYQALRAALQITGGTLTVGPGRLSADVDAMLKAGYAGRPLVIHEAVPGPGDGTANQVVIAGRAAFLATPYAGDQRGLPVTATFSVDQQGAVHARVRYAVAGEGASTGWTFSNSIPGLPIVINEAKPVAIDAQKSPLDELQFTQASFILASHGGDDPDYGIHLEPGINFAGRLGGSDPLGVFAQVLHDGGLVICGPVVIPDPGAAPSLLPPLGAGQYAWMRAGALPGINLHAALNGSLTLGRLNFKGGYFRVYSPPSYAWFNKNTSYRPAAAVTGTIVVKSADAKAQSGAGGATVVTGGIELDLTAETQSGASGATLSGVFTGCTLSKLASLLDIVGTDALIDNMPDEIKRIGDVLGRLELRSASVEVAKSGGSLSVVGTSATIGLLDQTWHIWPGTDHFNISGLYASFDVARPFDGASRQVAVTVGGTVAVEGVPISMTARRGDGYTVYAELATSQTIPLDRFMATYVPQVPPPSALTVDSLAVVVKPSSFYSFAATLAQQPHPWLIPLGPKTLAISDVAMTVVYPSGGPATGSFSGTIALDSIATLSIVYDVPGPFVIQAAIPQISLTDLAREIAGVLSLPKPDGFPEIDLRDSFVRFTRQGEQGNTIYDFLLRTTVAIGGTAGFNFGALIVRTAGKTGFSVGIWTPHWAEGQGWSPGTLWKPLSSLRIQAAGLVFSTIAPPDSVKGDIVPLKDVPALAQDKFKVVAGVSFFASLSLDGGGVGLLKQIFGDSAVFALFASLDTGTKATTLIAHLGTKHAKAAFTFDSIDLAWDSTGTSSASISITAAGSLSVDGEDLNYSVGGKIATESSATMKLAVSDWVHPFGYQRLTVKQFALSITLAQAGVEIALAGTFEFTTRKSDKFVLGVAGAVIDFEAPSALAFSLHSDSPSHMLTIGEVLEGITTIDVYDLPPGSEVIPWVAEIKLLDLFLKIQDLSFWVVTVAEIEIAGVTYKKGFGVKGNISLFGKPVLFYLDVQQAEKKFAGSAEFPEEIKLGSILLLGRPTTIAVDSKQDLARKDGEAAERKGPAMAVSSFIDADHPYYLFVASRVVLFDFINQDIVGQATNDGIKFSYDLTAGHSGSGVWASQHIDLLVSRDKLAFGAGIAYDFGLKNVTLGGFDLFGIMHVPAIPLPDFRIGFSGNIGAGLLPPQFTIGGSLTFSFMGLDFSPDFSLTLDLADAPGKLADLGAVLLEWIKSHLKDLMAAILNLAKKFAEWVKANFERLGEYASEVAQVFKDVFNIASPEVVKGLMTGIGYVGDGLETAVKAVYGAASEVCSITEAAVGL